MHVHPPLPNSPPQNPRRQPPHRKLGRILRGSGSSGQGRSPGTITVPPYNSSSHWTPLATTPPSWEITVLTWMNSSSITQAQQPVTAPNSAQSINSNPYSNFTLATIVLSTTTFKSPGTITVPPYNSSSHWTPLATTPPSWEITVSTWMNSSSITQAQQPVTALNSAQSINSNPHSSFTPATIVLSTTTSMASSIPSTT